VSRGASRLFLFERREDMSDQALRTKMDDAATRAADIQSALLFLQRATEFSETSDEVSEGFLQAARATLPKQVEALREIIGELRAAPEEGGDLENDPALDNLFDGE
jgi:hypothetical protein